VQLAFVERDSAVSVSLDGTVVHWDAQRLSIRSIYRGMQHTETDRQTETERERGKRVSLCPSHFLSECACIRVRTCDRPYVCVRWLPLVMCVSPQSVGARIVRAMPPLGRVGIRLTHVPCHAQQACWSQWPWIATSTRSFPSLPTVVTRCGDAARSAVMRWASLSRSVCVRRCGGKRPQSRASARFPSMD
jgi:hypothetical protein